MRLVRGSEVWEIHHEGTVVRVNGTVRRFLTGEHARAFYDKTVVEQREGGFHELPDAVADPQARMVLADEMQQRGDPQGELIAVQTALADDSLVNRERWALEKRQTALLETNHDRWWGKLAGFLRRPGKKLPLHPAIEVEWDRGFIATIRIQRAAKASFDEIYGELRRLPIARTVKKLVLGDPQLDTARTTTIHYGKVFSVMEREGIPPHLSELVIGDVAPARKGRIHLGDARGVIQACTNLLRLEITAGTGTIAPVVAPTLRELFVSSLSRTAVHPLIDSTLPALRELSITGVEARQLVELLLGAPLLQQLERLTLAHCHMQDADLSMFYMHARRFEHLAHLDLRGNHFSAGMVADVRTRLPQLIARGS